MKEKATITVLMPVYNAACYIREAMESILAQSYRDFVFLIIDDGSTDGTTDVIRSYADPRIKLITHGQNQGLKYSLNEGIRLSATSLIARMDADDYSHPWRLEKQTAYLDAHPHCAMVDSWVKLMDKDGRCIGSEGTYSKYVYYNLHFECCIYHSTIMFRKDMVERIGGYQLAYAEDYDLFLRMSQVYQIQTLEEPLLWYRIHDKNLNTVGKKKEYEDFTLRVLKQTFQFHLGKSLSLPTAFLSCYRYNMKPIIEMGNAAALKQCIGRLDELSEKIVATENPNRNAGDIEYIWNFKKKRILRELGEQLPLMEMVRLLWFYKLPVMALSIVLSRLKRHYAINRPYTR